MVTSRKRRRNKASDPENRGSWASLSSSQRYAILNAMASGWSASRG